MVLKNSRIYSFQKPIFVAPGSSLKKAFELSGCQKLSEEPVQSVLDSLQVSQSGNDSGVDTTTLIKRDNTQPSVSDSGIPRDELIQKKIQEIDKKSQEIDCRIDGLSKPLKENIQKSYTLQGYINNTFLFGFCPAGLGGIFGPAIPTILGAPALIPLVQKGMFAIFIAIGAVIGSMAYIKHREEKAIAPLYKESKELEKEKADLEKERRNIIEVRDLVSSVEGKSQDPGISDEDDYVEINGLKVEKHKFNLFQPRYTIFEGIL